jgi:hypothetical protein
MLNNELTNTGHGGLTTPCPVGGQEYPLSSFASLHNSQPADDGASTTITMTCLEYANTGGREPVRTIPAGAQVLWRYVTSDGKWVLVRDPRVPDGSGNWIFVARSCLPGTLPYQAPPVDAPLGNVYAPTELRRLVNASDV